MQTIYAMHQSGSDNLEKQEKFLSASLENIQDLYLIMVSTLTEMRKKEIEYIEIASKKHLATPEERKTVLFVSTAGEPGPGTYEAVEALIKKHEVEKVSLAYDRDKGGNHLTEKVRAHLVEKHQELTVNDVREDMGMQPGEDANDLLLRLQAERLQQIEREADREPPAVAREEVIQTASVEQTAPGQAEPNDDQLQPEAGKPHSVGQEGALEVEDEEQQYEYYSGFELDD